MSTWTSTSATSITASTLITVASNLATTATTTAAWYQIPPGMLAPGKPDLTDYPAEMAEEMFGVIRQHLARAGLASTPFIDDGIDAAITELLDLRAKFAKGKPRDTFNAYVNASDLLEEFIGFLGTQKVRKREVLELPLDLFVKWLVIRACEEDKVEPNVVLALPAPKRALRCSGCQRFMRAGPVPFHDARCADFYFRRAA